MTEAVRKLKKSEDKRELLIEFKNKLKNGELRVTEDDNKYILSLLALPDPKSRKNVAQILGIVSLNDSVPALIGAYETEETEYVKASYIVALKDMELNEEQTEKLEKLREELAGKEVPEENKKHIDEQIAAFNDVLGMKIGKHVFTGNNISSDIILVTARGLGHITAELIDNPAKKVLGIGVSVKTDNLDEILKLRTYREMLFLIPELKRISDDPYKAAEAVAESELKAFLDKRHDNALPWSYRLAVMSTMDDKRKSMFIKRFTGELQRHSDGAFVNSASDYELELRLIESKDGGFTPMVRLFTIKDNRFDYRKEVVASSIRPDLAANLVKLSEDYLRTDVQVLDPFCGTGTMLVERCRFKDAYPVYGIDIYGEAIAGAKINAEAAGLKMFFVNRDYFDFTHKYKFDEIITNMPFATKSEDKPQIRSIYSRFFEHSKPLLKRNAYVILYVRDIDYAREFSVANGYLMEKEMLISDKEDSYLCIYRKK